MAEHPLVGEARGIGLAGSVELVADKASKAAFGAGVKARLGAHVRQCALRHGIISRGFSDIRSFSPPIIITEERIDEMFERFTLALDDIAELLRSEGVLGA